MSGYNCEDDNNLSDNILEINYRVMLVHFHESICDFTTRRCG